MAKAVPVKRTGPPSWAQWPEGWSLAQEMAHVRDESSRMVDNLDRKDVAQVCFLGLSKRDLENLRALADADPRARNYAVLVRRLISRAAKELE